MFCPLLVLLVLFLLCSSCVVCLYFFYICLSFFMSCSSVVIGAAVFFVDVLLLPFNFWPVVRSDFCVDGLHRYLVNSGDCS